MPPCVQEVEDRGAGAANVKKAGRGGSEAEFHPGREFTIEGHHMRRQKGFSLVELLFALLVLTIVITTSLAVFVERTRRLRQASELILVTQALANEAEIIRRIYFNSDPITRAPGLDGLDDQFDTDVSILDPLKPFTTKIEVTLIRPGVKKVTMSVRWGNNKESKLSLLRTDTGGTNLW